jgi:ferredoxin-NADP reductase
LLLGNVFARIINPDWRQAFVLRRKEFVSSSIGNFWFDPARRFNFRPGQFLEYTFAHPDADARGIRRYFSIASSPTEPAVLLTSRFAKEGSTFKAALRGMKEGDEIIAAKVAGDFILPSDSAQKLGFIAGGIGITPFRSIIKYLLDTKEARDIVLVYAVREEQEVAFRDIFDEAEATFGLRTVYRIGGVIEETALRKEVPDWQERVWYISGPEPMVQALTRMLRGMGVPRRHIKRDYFPGYPA